MSKFFQIGILQAIFGCKAFSQKRSLPISSGIVLEPQERQMTVKAVFPVIGSANLPDSRALRSHEGGGSLSVTWGITCCKHLTVHTIDFRLLVL